MRSIQPGAVSGATRAILSAGVPRIADAATPKDDAIGLLKLAAEVEHALLVQYLYAASSINPDASPASKRARDTVTAIAIEEMGHLLGVQNLLLALGGTSLHHLGRDGMRAASERNPLPLALEPISHSALAKFVTVERPADIADKTLREVVERLGKEAEQSSGFSPHPVSALYLAISLDLSADRRTVRAATTCGPQSSSRLAPDTGRLRQPRRDWSIRDRERGVGRAPRPSRRNRERFGERV